MKKWKVSRLTQTQMLALGYILIILIGAGLLMLPVSTREGISTPFVDALFTAASAACVTGLVVRDTSQYWSTFGQCVLLVIIQTGGLGFMTIGIFFATLLRRKVGLWMRGTMQESVNALQIGGMVRLAKFIIRGTLLIEGTGAILLTMRFSETMKFGKALFYGIFHSVSAFCNAGFDLMGERTPYASFTAYYNDWWVNLVLMTLIILGGLGFYVWGDLKQNKCRFRKYSLHTKLVVLTTIALLVAGTVLLFIVEQEYTLKGMPLKEQILCSMFGSVTARTAGFNTVDTAALSDSGKLITIILMFIGGSPGSTAGGIKTTTFLVLIVYVVASLQQKKNCNIFGRRLDEGSIQKASSVLCINLFAAVAAIVLITSVQDISVQDVMFEVFSAIGTVGMTTGVTREMETISKLVLILLMYCGRVGSLTFAFSLRGHKVDAPVKQPVEQIMIG